MTSSWDVGTVDGAMCGVAALRWLNCAAPTPRRARHNRNGRATTRFAIRASTRKCVYVTPLAAIASAAQPPIAARASRRRRASFVSAAANFVLVREGARPCALICRRFLADLMTARHLRLNARTLRRDGPMTLKFGLRDGALSAAIFGGVIFALVSFDPRVRDHLSTVVGDGASVAPLSGRLTDLASVLWSAARHQSIDNAPLVVFGTVGIVLTIFMLRS
jgi:hypothetical protein